MSTSRNQENPLSLDINHLMEYLPSSQWAFWKNLNSTYKGCNPGFAGVTGVGAPKDIVGLKISDLRLSNNKVLADCSREFEEIDHRVYDCIESYELKRGVFFEGTSAYYDMTCKVFPIVNDSEKVLGLLGIGNGRLISPNQCNIFHLVNKWQISNLLKKPRYVIQSGSLTISLSRRQTACLLYLMKGQTAREMADHMCITKRAAESYINLLKDKFGCYSKSQMIYLAFESNLLEELSKTQSDDSEVIIQKINSTNCLYDGNERIYIKI